MTTLLNDIRYSVRVLLKSPGFTAAAIAVLALGIGANAAIFSLVNVVLLERLPYADPDRLVMVWENRPGPDGSKMPAAPANVFEWRAANSVFEDVGWSADQTFNLTGEGDPESLLGYRFSPNFLSVMGVQPRLGRNFLPEEGRPGSNRVILLSDRLWRTRFNADPNVIGRRVVLNGTPYAVVGVMPESFKHPSPDTQLWAPLALTAAQEQRRDIRVLRLVARLKPQVSPAEAQRELTQLYARMATEFPATNQSVGVNVVPLSEMVTGEARTPLLVLLGAVGFVLLIACANVANLLLARAVGRQKEVAIRLALGASRVRVLRQVLVESVVLGLAGGAVGLVVAVWSVNGLVAMFPQTISNLPVPRIASVPVDARVAVFTIVASLAAGLAFGLLPAIYASRPDLIRGLKEARISAASGNRVRRVLVVSEIALSMLLLVGALLMIRSFGHLRGAELGFVPDGVLSMRMLLPSYKYRTPEDMRAFATQTIERVRVLPGVDSTGMTNYLPLSGWWGTRDFRVEGKPTPRPGEEPSADFRLASPDYFRTMGIRVLRGRAFVESDTPAGPPVVIVNETLARQHWPGEDPVGKRLIVGSTETPVAWDVVGVVQDVKSFGVNEETHAELFRPMAQEPSPLLGLVVRTSGDPESLALSVRRAVSDVDKDQPVSYVTPMAALASESLAFQRVSALLIAAFAALALVLASVGIYGVLAYVVTQRRRDIGIRLALGAERRSILRMIVRQGLSLGAAGGALGLVLALGLSKVLQTMLFGITPLDPASFLAAVVVVPIVAACASALPGWRATRVDPIKALRED